MMGNWLGLLLIRKGRLEGDGGSPPSGWEEVGRRDEGVDQRVNLGTRNERRSSQRMVNRGVVSIPELDSSPSSSRLSKRDIISVTLEELEGPEIGSISVLLTIMQAIIDAAKKPKADIVVSLSSVLLPHEKNSLVSGIPSCAKISFQGLRRSSRPNEEDGCFYSKFADVRNDRDAYKRAVVAVSSRPEH